MSQADTPRTLIGAALLALGATVLLGWLLKYPLMVRFSPGFVPMVFNTALCFVGVGAAIVLPGVTRKPLAALQDGVGALQLAVGALSFAEMLFDVSFGIDLPSLHLWIGDGNVRPGRMAPNTALSFMAIGAALALMSRVSNKRRAVATQVLTVCVLALGLTGLVGYALAPDLLYGWASSARMAIHTAVGMMLAGSALWLGWNKADWYRSRSHFKEDEKIVFMGCSILVVLAMTAGLIGFVSQQAVLEKTLRQRLSSNFDNRLLLFRTSIAQALESAAAAARRPGLIDATRRLGRDPANADAAADLEAIGKSLLASGFRGALLYDQAGAELLRTGRFAASSPFAAALPGGGANVLLWADGLWLRTTLRVVDDAGALGTLVLERSLDALYAQLTDVGEFGATGETGICVGAGKNLLCLPQSRNPVLYRPSRFSTYGQPLAMSRALGGAAGVVNTLDYRGKNVVAAYGLLAPGLGMVLKQDTVELYAVIRDQLRSLLMWLTALVALGAALLRSQLKPLALRLLRSEAAAADKEQQIATLLGSVDEGILTIDEDGAIQSFNPAASRIFGYAAADVLGRNIKMLMPSDMHAPHDGGMRRYLQGGAARVVGRQSVELPGLRAGGAVFPLELSINDMRVGGQRQFVGIVRDITARKRAEQALFAEKERLHVTLNSIGDAVITTDTAGLVTYLNPVAERMTGWPDEEALGRPLPEVFKIIDERTQEPAHDPVQAVLRSGQLAGLEENTVLIHRHSGQRFAVEDSAAPIRGREGEMIGVVLVFHDVSAARKMAAEMTHQATHDPLTGLINRREFERRVELSLQTGKIQHKEHTLLYLDLDQFKIVNDTCGHVAGDELLRQLSSVLNGKLRQTDTLARLGGDEFGVLLDSCPTPAAARIAEMLRASVNDFRFVWKDKSFAVGVTIGLVTYSNDSMTLGDVLGMADSACYVAKEKGRNRVQVYRQEDAEFAHRQGQMGWVARIRAALEDNRFVLYSQEIAALDAGAGAAPHHELLIRMRDEDGAIVPPMAFIPAAERYGLMPSIDRWVVRTALAGCASIDGERAAGTVYAINLSGATLCDDDFLQFIRGQFQQSAVDPASICFEITETVAIANLVQATALMRELRAIGCQFALDDFGSGMSSFAYLKHLPVHYLKIDGSFVKDMVKAPIDRAMVESINHIGHVMGIRTIAEFVEDEATLEALREIGVDFAQGYAIQRPQPWCARQ
ncbi:diguanylate cyclase (GGDEF)-like protein/PAS domain S-box-containing protein [Janthinobacterium sp. CG_23.3]|uniref:EAL domain-containing protein n=1 Tax=Janthinobacterium sp. CG_23.3 TaxID=3349634 RepID=UPI0038D4D061